MSREFSEGDEVTASLRLVRRLGAGGAVGDYMAMKSQEEQAQLDRKFVRDREKRITNSYHIDPAALAGGEPWEGDPTVRPKPSVAWAYNTDTGMIERGA